MIRGHPYRDSVGVRGQRFGDQAQRLSGNCARINATHIYFGETLRMALFPRTKEQAGIKSEESQAQPYASFSRFFSLALPVPIFYSDFVRIVKPCPPNKASFSSDPS